MMIYLKDTERIITAVEGTGDNLTAHDLDDGFVDYMMTSIYKQDGDELMVEDAGQLMFMKPVADHNTEELVDRLRDYWEAKDGDYIILNY